VDICYFTQAFYHRKPEGYMLICRNAEAVHGVRKMLGTPTPDKAVSRRTQMKLSNFFTRT